MKRLSPFPQIETKDCDLQGFTISKLGKKPFCRNFVCVRASPKTR